MAAKRASSIIPSKKSPLASSWAPSEALVGLVLGVVDEVKFAVPDSVGLIAHSGTANLDGWDLDYGEMLATVAPGSDWIAALADALKDRGVQVDTWATAWFGVLLVALRSVPIFVFFVPLALWIAWYASRQYRRRRKLPWAKT